MGESSIYGDLVSKKSSDGADGGQENTINLRELICQTLDIPSEDLSDDLPLTQYGLDSLSAAFLSVQLSSVITISQIQLLADVTLAQLQERMGQDPSQAPPEDTKEEAIAKKVKAMHEMADKYGSNFVCNATEGRPDEDHKIILLTGSTGSVGAHMLARLLASDKAVKIYAFLRKQREGGNEVNVKRQRAAFVDRGLDVSLLDSSKLTILSGNLTESFMGLGEETYEEVSDSFKYPSYQGCLSVLDTAHSRSHAHRPHRLDGQPHHSSVYFRQRHSRSPRHDRPFAPSIWSPANEADLRQYRWYLPRSVANQFLHILLLMMH